jgi:hypothetical protein
MVVKCLSKCQLGQQRLGTLGHTPHVASTSRGADLSASAEARKRLHLLAGVLELLVVMVAWTVLVLGYQENGSHRQDITSADLVTKHKNCPGNHYHQELEHSCQLVLATWGVWPRVPSRCCPS